MPNGWGLPPSGGGGGAPTPNSPLYSPNSGNGARPGYGAGNEPVVYGAKPMPRGAYLPPRMTQDPPGLQPAGQPMPQGYSQRQFDQFAPGGMSRQNTTGSWLPPQGRPAGQPPQQMVGQWLAPNAGQAAPSAQQGQWLNPQAPAQAPSQMWMPNAPAPAAPPPRRGYTPRGNVQLANSAPNYGARLAGTSQSLGGGWWHNPSQSTSNAPGWWHDSTGAGQDLNKRMAMQSGQATGGAGGGGGYSGRSDLDSIGRMYEDAQAAANAKNEERYAEILGGYSAARKRSNELLDQLGGQQRSDTNTIYDQNRGRLTQDMISTGLTASTVRDNLLTGNERKRGEGLARLEESLAQQRLNTEYGQTVDQLKFMEARTDQQPDPALYAELMKAAAAAGGGGGGGYMGPPTVLNMPSMGWPVYGMGQTGGYMPRARTRKPPTGGKGEMSGVGGTMGGGMGVSPPPAALDGVMSGTGPSPLDLFPRATGLPWLRPSGPRPTGAPLPAAGGYAPRGMPGFSLPDWSPY